MKQKRGVKRTCPETGRRFYDLSKDPIISPFTNKVYPLSYFLSANNEDSMINKGSLATIKKSTNPDLVEEIDALEEDKMVLKADLDDDILPDDNYSDTLSLEEIKDIAAETEDK